VPLREGSAFGQAEALADGDGFAERRGARGEVLGGALGVELGETASREAEVVKGDSAGDLPLGRPPGERPVEEGHGLAELLGRRSQVRERRREVVERPGVPSVLGVFLEVLEGHGERASRSGEVRRRAGTPVEHGGVVKEPGPLFFGVERERREQLPQVVGERAGGLRVAAFAQLLLRPEPVAVGADRIAGERGVKVAAKLVPACVHRRQRYARSAHDVPPRAAGSAR